jgi:hypothetical protein
MGRALCVGGGYLRGASGEVSALGATPRLRYPRGMQALRAHVRRGRLVMDEPTDFPEGTTLELVAVGGADDLDDESRAELHAALDDALAEPDEAGMDVADLIAELRARG